MPVIIDHLGRPGQGTPQEYEQVLRLAELANVHIKFTATRVTVRPREEAPPLDTKMLARRVYDAFGAERIIWGELGDTTAALDKAREHFELTFDFAPEREKARIRGGNAQKLFGF